MSGHRRRQAERSAQPRLKPSEIATRAVDSNRWPQKPRAAPRRTRAGQPFRPASPSDVVDRSPATARPSLNACSCMNCVYCLFGRMVRGRPKRNSDPKAIRQLEAFISRAKGQSRAASLLGVHASTLSRTRSSKTISRELAELLRRTPPPNPSSPTQASVSPSVSPQAAGHCEKTAALLLLLQEVSRLLPEALAEQKR